MLVPEKHYVATICWCAYACKLQDLYKSGARTLVPVEHSRTVLSMVSTGGSVYWGMASQSGKRVLMDKRNDFGIANCLAQLQMRKDPAGVDVMPAGIKAMVFLPSSCSLPCPLPKHCAFYFDLPYPSSSLNLIKDCNVIELRRYCM